MEEIKCHCIMSKHDFSVKYSFQAFQTYFNLKIGLDI